MNRRLKKIIAGFSLFSIAFATVNIPFAVNAEEIEKQDMVEAEGLSATPSDAEENEEINEEINEESENSIEELNLEKAENSPVTKDEIGAMTSDLTDIINDNLTSEKCVYGNEWNVMTIARAGTLSNDMAENYYNSVIKELAENPNLDNKATTYAKVIIALSAIGKNPENVNGVNLLKPLSDMEFVKEGGVNTVMYVLIALDTKNYSIPEADNGKTQTTREELVKEILAHEVTGGGWDWSDTAADPDMTAIGIQALTPYYDKNPEAKAAVDRALVVLSDMQNDDGSFSSYGWANACSTAQVVTALTSIGINPLTDSRFVKGNGFSALDGISMFYVKGQGINGYGDEIDLSFSTVQAAYALVAFDRLVNGKNSLYNMKDEAKVETTIVSEKTETEKTDKSPNTGDEVDVSVIMLLLVVSGLCIITQKRRYRA